MGLDDIFGFDANAYAIKVRYLTVPELKARELAKTRQVLTSSAAGGASFGAAFATGGLTLVFTALSLRKIDVAKKKLDMVVAELQRRRVPLKENVTRRDKALAIVGADGDGCGEAMGNAISGDGAAAVGGGGGGGGGDAYFPHVTAEQMAGSAAGAGVQWAMMQFGRRDKCKDPYCASADGHFDMCHQCYNKGMTCHGPSHQLTMYFAYQATETWQSIYTADDLTKMRLTI
ncbi:unnamed protein product [Parascedosporium putredinis]|uniref:Uncharacterized protein n=1 Tax=Parascedosporium putredinis TaxID=1442378 RepID=A0A9P1M8D0_9PEZI|nr:unnamed protein product [Parascedosporium putredinis]CAI7992410.1 unnamed protein product [Parascedosporium putredinis]